MLKKYSLFIRTLAICAISALNTSYATSEATSNPLEQPQPSISASTGESVLFTPPSGWKIADQKSLLPSVKIMVVGKGAREYPPSINLGTEIYSGTIKQYLKRIKDINASQGATWKDLGKIRTEAGMASLSQVDKKTEWGEVRMMHVILNKDGTIYILTASSLKEEFPKFYKDFFSALSSLRFK